MRFGILGSRGYPSTYGGYETLVRHLAPYLVEAGHEVAVYCRDHNGGPRAWTADGVRCIASPGLETKSLSTLSFGMTSTMDASLRHFDAMLVLNIANGFWFPALRAARTPFAVNTDGIEWERGKWSTLGRATFRAAARMTAWHADALVCDSQAIAEIWKKLFHRESNFIPYGAPVLENVGCSRIKPLGLANERYVLVVARLVPENNVELTLDALDLLGEDAPRAVIVGSANFDSPIESRLKEAQASQRVQWLGHVDDQDLLNELWANAAVYAHGHSVGGTNPSLLQALGAGAPTLALNTPFNTEVLPYPDQQFSRDADELAARIKQVVDSPTLREQMSDRGRRIVGRCYAWGDVCDAYTDLLTSLALGTYRTPRSPPVASRQQTIAARHTGRERRARAASEAKGHAPLTQADVAGDAVSADV